MGLPVSARCSASNSRRPAASRCSRALQLFFIVGVQRPPAGERGSVRGNAKRHRRSRLALIPVAKGDLKREGETGDERRQGRSQDRIVARQSPNARHKILNLKSHIHETATGNRKHEVGSQGL